MIVLKKKNLNQLLLYPRFSCPVCRQKTIIPWYNRPINRLALENLRNNEEYEQAYEKYIKEKDLMIPPIPLDINLATLTTLEIEN